MAAAMMTMQVVQAEVAFTNLYSFSDTTSPLGPSVLVQGYNGNFYGTTIAGGISNGGSVFMITSSGTFTTLYSFTNGTDGGGPQGGLVQGTDSNFYGTTMVGGQAYNSGGPNNGYTNNSGTVFRISSDGAFATICSFRGTNGTFPNGTLIQASDGNFYGTTLYGGANGVGTVFKVTASGVLTSLYSFNGTNGALPYAGLVQGSDGNFYGTTDEGGVKGWGTIFEIGTNGILTSLYSFTNGIDGISPSGLVLGGDGDFYGTCAGGGHTGGDGTVFKVSPVGVFTVFYTFSSATNGGGPDSGVILGSDGNFYGTTFAGGDSTNGSFGTVFELTQGGMLTTLYSFTGYADGAFPRAGLVEGSDGSFYGSTTESGELGPDGYGGIFRITVVAASSPTIQTNAAIGFTNGTFGFTMLGPSGSNVVIQGSRDLKNWTPLQTNRFGSDPFYFSDPQSLSNLQRFYRAVSQ